MQTGRWFCFVLAIVALGGAEKGTFWNLRVDRAGEDSEPSFNAVPMDHSSEPKGEPRWTLRLSR